MTTTPTTRHDAIPRIILTCLFWALYLVAMNQQWRIEFIPQSWFSPERIPYEFRFVEQLSKYAGLLMLGVSVWAYRCTRNAHTAKLSIALILFGLVTTMSEGDFISNRLQLALGPLLMFVILGLTWIPPRTGGLVYCLGCFVIGLGVIGDIIHDSHMGNYIEHPAWYAVTHFLTWNEDALESLGMLTICFSSFYMFFEDLYPVVMRNKIGSVALAVCLLAVAVGNSFLYHGYTMESHFRVNAFLLSLGACVGFYLTNRLLIDGANQMTLFNRQVSYVTLFLFFVVLPAIYSQNGPLINLLIWAPLLVIITNYLYKRHPLLARTDQSDDAPQDPSRPT